MDTSQALWLGRVCSQGAELERSRVSAVDKHGIATLDRPTPSEDRGAAVVEAVRCPVVTLDSIVRSLAGACRHSWARTDGRPTSSRLSYEPLLGRGRQPTRQEEAAHDTWKEHAPRQRTDGHPPMRQGRSQSVQQPALWDTDHPAGKEPDEERPGKVTRSDARNKLAKKESPKTATYTPPGRGSGGPVVARCSVAPQHQPLGYAHQSAEGSSHDRTGIGLGHLCAESAAKRKTGKEAYVRREYPESPEPPTRAFSLELKKGSQQGAPHAVQRIGLQLQRHGLTGSPRFWGLLTDTTRGRSAQPWPCPTAGSC